MLVTRILDESLHVFVGLNLRNDNINYRVYKLTTYWCCGTLN